MEENDIIISRWLEKLKLNYSEVFKENGYDNYEAFENLSADELRSIKVKPGHIKKILKSVPDLLQELKSDTKVKNEKTPTPSTENASFVITTASSNYNSNPINMNMNDTYMQPSNPFAKVVWIHPKKGNFARTEWRDHSKASKRQKISNNEWREQVQLVRDVDPPQLIRGRTNPFPRVIGVPIEAIKVKIVIKGKESEPDLLSGNEVMVSNNREADFTDFQILKSSFNPSTSIHEVWTLIFWFCDANNRDFDYIQCNPLPVLTAPHQLSLDISLSELVPDTVPTLKYTKVVLFGNFRSDPTLKVVFDVEQKPHDYKASNCLLAHDIYSDKDKTIDVFVEQKGKRSNSLKFSFFSPEVNLINDILQDIQLKEGSSNLLQFTENGTQLPPEFLEQFSRDGLASVQTYQDAYGFSLLHWSCGQGDKKLTSFCLENKFDINLQDYYGCTPLHWAMWSKNIDLISLLLSKGANCNISDDFGISPLHIAYNIESVELVALLMKYNADCYCEDNYGFIPSKYSSKELIIPSLKSTGVQLRELNNQEMSDFIEVKFPSLIQEGINLFQQKAYTEALNKFEEYLNLDSKYEYGLEYKAYILFLLKQYEQALACYQELIAINSKGTTYYYNSAFIHYSKENYITALEFLNKSLQIRPNYTKSLSLKALIFEKLNDIDLATICIEKALLLEPNNQELLEHKERMTKSHSNERNLNKCQEFQPEIQTIYELKVYCQKLEKELEESKIINEKNKKFIQQLENDNKELLIKNQTLNNQLNYFNFPLSKSQLSHHEEIENDLEIKSGDIEKQGKVGEGAFASVYRGKWRGHFVALKELKVTKLGDSLEKIFKTEVRLMCRFKHPNITRLFGICLQEDSYTIVMEYLPLGSLYNQLHEQKVKLNVWTQIKLATDISNGLNYLHQSKPKIVHRDLKSHNILLDEYWNAKLTDFGLAKVKTESERMSGSVCGSPPWMAPEFFEENPIISEKVDIYSFGMVLYEMASNLTPFHNFDHRLLNTFAKRQRPIIPDECEESLKILIEKCWNENPKLRPTPVQILGSLEECLNEKGFLDEFQSSLWDFTPDFLHAKGWLAQNTYRSLEMDPRHFTNNSCMIVWEKLNNLIFENMHGVENVQITKAYAIESEHLKNGFKTRIKTIHTRLKEDPDTFRNASWEKNRATWRKMMLDNLELYTQQFVSSYSQLKIIPVFHAVKKVETAWKICASGFANLSINDDGWYGKGIYFTTNLRYAAKYYGEVNDKGEYILILSYVILGSVYPCVEHPQKEREIKGKDCQKGYDAHVTYVSPSSLFPCELNSSDIHENYSEIVIFQENQCLPKYLLFCKLL